MFLPRIFKGKVSKQKGKEFEELAAKYLRRKGYKILERNFRKRFGEIDIIALKDNVLVFVEVRSLAGNFMDPSETITLRKRTNLLKVASVYLMERGWRGPVRFDFIGIKGRDKEIEHIENFFEV